MDGRMISNHAGLEYSDPGFRLAGQALLRLLFCLSPESRGTILFGGAWYCLPLQKALRRALGGAFLVRGRFTEGTRGSLLFECSSAEKYFLLGANVERDADALLTALVRRGDVAYDIGGHIGYTALLYSALCGPTGRVFVFEPSPANRARLQRNADLNPGSNVSVVGCAASAVSGVLRFAENGSMSAITGDGGVGVEVRAIRIDDFVYRDGNPAPSFAKIDVEGHAGGCLDGMREVLRVARPTLLIETHDGEEETQVRRILSEYSYAWRQTTPEDAFPKRMLAQPA
jgi:FkbM family methyltransferase